MRTVVHVPPRTAEHLSYDVRHDVAHGNVVGVP